MSRVMAIVWKEWIELRQQRGLIFGVAIAPLLITGSLINALATAGRSAAGLGALAGRNAGLAGLTPVEAGQALAGQQLALLLLIFPLMVPVVIAAHSIVGEKTGHTLEPLLATPTATWEILLGKCLAALIPAALITWLCTALFLVGVARTAASDRVVRAVASPGWLILIVLGTPLLSLISVAVTVAVSARATDPRTAQQISMAVMLPILVAVVLQVTGLLVFTPLVSLAAVVVVGAVAALALGVAVRVFRREKILTTWR